MYQALSQVISVCFLSFNQSKNPTRCFYAHFTEEGTEAKRGETAAQSLGKIPKQDSEAGGESDNILSGWGGGGGGKVEQGEPLHTWPQQQGVGYTFPIPSSNPFG